MSRCCVLRPAELGRPIVDYLLLALAVGLQWLTSPSLGIAAVAWVSLVPLALFATHSFRARRYVAVYLAGFVYYLLAASWLRTRYGAGGTTLMDALPWLSLSAVLAPSWVIAVYLLRAMRSVRCPYCFSLAVAWTVSEYARWHLFALLDETGFPYLQLGATQIDYLPVVQIADIGGVWGVTALVALVNGVWIDLTGQLLCKDFRRATANAAATAGLLACVIGYGFWRLGQSNDRPGPTICLMPIVNQLDRASLGPLTPDDANNVRRADLLLWSECAYPETLPPHSDAQSSAIIRSLEQLAREQKTALVVGCVRFETATGATEMFNSALVIDGCRGFQGWYDKLCLAPWSEFIPRCDVSFMNLLTSEFSHGREYDVFTLSDKHCDRTYRAALAICYDICFPANFARTAKRQPFDLILSCSSEASDSTGWVRTVNLTASRIRAIEFRRSVVRQCPLRFFGVHRW